MKRRALISATAVMLVALMCLVTASYAWFTASGEGKIETFEVKVSGADAALQLSLDGATWVNTLSKDDFVGAGQTVADTLQALSTPDATTFFKAPYDPDNSNWVAAAITEGEKDYIAIDFYAYAPEEGSADFNINFSKKTFAEGETETITDFQFAAFKNAVKIGYKVGDGDFQIYDIAAGETYQPVKAAGAIAEKNAAGAFVPTTATADKFDDARTQTAWSTQTIDFDGGIDKPEHIYVVIWLEGMDKQCTGNFDMNSVNIDIGFSNFR